MRVPFSRCAYAVVLLTTSGSAENSASQSAQLMMPLATEDVPVTKVFQGMILQEIVRTGAWEDSHGASKNKWVYWGAAATGALAAPPLLTAAVAGLGFTSAGIAAGSAAASMMSLSGGAVSAGGLVATLQSIGAAGLGTVGTAVASAGGGAAVMASVSGMLKDAFEKVKRVANGPTNQDPLSGVLTIEALEGNDGEELILTLSAEALNQQKVIEAVHNGMNLAVTFVEHRVSVINLRKAEGGDSEGFSSLFELVQKSFGDVTPQRNGDDSIVIKLLWRRKKRALQALVKKSWNYLLNLISVFERLLRVRTIFKFLIKDIL